MFKTALGTLTTAVLLAKSQHLYTGASCPGTNLLKDSGDYANTAVISSAYFKRPAIKYLQTSESFPGASYMLSGLPVKVLL